MLNGNKIGNAKEGERERERERERENRYFFYATLILIKKNIYLNVCKYF